MHYHCEVIMPPCADIKQSINEIMLPFCEHDDIPCEDRSSYQFWDWFQIGGRWSGIKFRASLDQKKLDEFYKELTKRKITVSGVQFGKQELSPPSQCSVVDSLWNEFFPQANGKACLLFKHAGEQSEYDSMPVNLIPMDMTASRVIFAGPDYEGKKQEATFMVSENIWNGVNHEKTEWNGTMKHAFEMFTEKASNYAEEWRTKITPIDEWICVTIDYHS